MLLQWLQWRCMGRLLVLRWSLLLVVPGLTCMLHWKPVPRWMLRVPRCCAAALLCASWMRGLLLLLLQRGRRPPSPAALCRLLRLLLLPAILLTQSMLLYLRLRRLGCLGTTLLLLLLRCRRL